MSTKRNLKSSLQYSDVFIHKDQTVQQRIERKNFQVIVDVLKSVNPHIDMKGTEVTAKRSYDYQNPKRNDKTQNTRSKNGHNRYAQNERRDRRDTNRNTHNRGHNAYLNSDNRQERRGRHSDSRARHGTRWQISAGFWNVNNWNKDFISENNKFRSYCINNLDLDIVGIAETHLKGGDILKVNGYHWIGQNRKHRHRNAKTGSGGIGIFVK